MLFSIVVLSFFATFYAAPVVKHLAGPPSEFHLHSVPDPATVLTLQRSASRNIWFTGSSGLIASHTFPIETPTFAVSFASPVSGLKLELLNPSGSPAQARVEEGTFRVDDDDKDRIPMIVYIVTDAAIGSYTLNVHRTATVSETVLNQVMNNPRADAVISFFVDDNIEIHSHLQSYLLKVGSEVGLVAMAIPSPTADASYAQAAASRGTMEVTFPDGTSIDIPMHDDGLTGGDLTAGDMQYSASIKVTQPGVYILESILDGQIAMDSDATDSFERTAQHIVSVSSATVDLSHTAYMQPLSGNRAEIFIGLVNGDQQQPTLRAYAEVWGTARDGTMQPICWIGGIVSIASGNVGLEMPLDYITKEITGPLFLRNVYLSDIATSFPVAISTAVIPVDKSEILSTLWEGVDNVTITEEMRFGVNPIKDLVGVAGAPNLLLLPGYCTDENPFARNSADFTNGFYPVDKGNYGNDQYAQKILKQVETAGMGSYGIVAHSQGGMVGTHLSNFYFTGLDSASMAGKPIQSIGTPYNGNTAAGSAANLGEIFGVGCGTNTDLSRDGAVNWLSGISSAARSKVSFYTTTYKQGTLFGDWCSLPMNLILQWPNDGVTELTYAPLSGAVNMGNKQEWCHSTDMGYAPQTNDHGRNAVMNSAASR